MLNTIKVKNKDGKEKTVVVDADQQDKYGKMVKEIHNHDTCLDIFRDLLDVVKTGKKGEIKPLKMEIDPKKFIKMKMARNKAIKILRLLKMALSLHVVTGLAYLKCILLRIELNRALFIVEIEQGQETFIPSDLSQSRLPYSMRYYDSILAIV